ncbi:MAG: M48 family metalloprotease [Lautropia sp.]
MDFSRHQQESARTSARLRFAYATAVIAVVVVFDVAAWLGWRALFGAAPLPAGFMLINTLATAGLIVGGTLIERQRLAADAALLPERLGARALAGGASRSFIEQRAINVTEELALAARQPIPRLFLLERDPSINAFATGLAREDATVVLTRGALERLDRDELQGVVAHEIAHLASGDVVVNTTLAAMNYGLELVAQAGRRIVAASFGPRSQRGLDLRSLFVLPGLLLLAVGSAGHLAARLLSAAIGRAREHHADALAIRLTRSPQGLGNALRKIAWLASRELLPARGAGAPVGLEHALFHFETPGFGRWLATHPPLEERIERLLGGALPPLAAVRGADDDGSLSLDAARTAAALEKSALPLLAYDADAEGAADAARGAFGALARPRLVEQRGQLAALLATGQHVHGAAAMAALLILGHGTDAEVWPQRWAPAVARQRAIAEQLRLIGPTQVERLRWPLLEVCAATIRPLATPWQDDLLRMLRGQIELDQRVTLAEWIYYMLLRTRIVPAHRTAWRGDEADANPAEAVRWMVSVLATVVREPALRGERVAHDIVRDLGLPRTGQSYPPLDVGGLQAAVASLRHLPMLQRPLLMKRLVAFLPDEAPIEARDFLRVLALIIDCPLPQFAPIVMTSPDTAKMPTELTRIVAGGSELVD